jgi:hypothetical protein
MFLLHVKWYHQSFKPETEFWISFSARTTWIEIALVIPFMWGSAPGPKKRVHSDYYVFEERVSAESSNVQERMLAFEKLMYVLFAI